MGNFANFYNSKNNDRLYDAESFEEWLKPLFKSGVINGEMQVKALNNMTIRVESGNAYINGKHKFFNNYTILTIDSANPTLDRIDNIVVRRNDTDRDFILMVQKGAESLTPSAPMPVRTGGIYDLVLAEVYVTKSAIAINQGNITDTRMSSTHCGWVVGAVEQITFDQIAVQFNSFFENFKTTNRESFNTWFQEMQTTLNGTSYGRTTANIRRRVPVVLTDKTLAGGSAWTSTTQRSWDSAFEYKFRQFLSVDGMTDKDIVLKDNTIILGDDGNIGYCETATNGIYFYSKTQIARVVSIPQLIYLVGVY